MSAGKISVNSITGPANNGIILDDRSFEIFFRENFVRFCVYCQYKFGFDVQAAKEAVHTAFIKLWEIRYTIDRNASLLPYFQRMVHNNCIDFLKHEKVKLRYKNAVLNDSGFNISENSFTSMDAKQLQSDIYQAIDQLPEQMRAIFRLSRFEGQTYADIARNLNISVKTVETQMSRALLKLKKNLQIYFFTL